jgi:hypothetical protein
MPMLAWAGPHARPPGDLDWISLDRLAIPIDLEHPYPHVESIEDVQQWPEAAAGAARYDLWREEEFGTAGSHPYVPPEGVHWVPDLNEYQPRYLQSDLVELLHEHPKAAQGVLFDPDGVRKSQDWAYTYSYGGGLGVRLKVPWQAEGLKPGLLQLDFAADETLLEPPVWAAIPRADGGPPTPVRAASRETSLAWKLLWLYTDASAGYGSQGKDLYDAVLLAESDQTGLTPQLLHKTLRRSLRERTDEFRIDEIHVTEEEWEWFQRTHPAACGTAGEWLARLGRALPQWAISGTTLS